MFQITVATNPSPSPIDIDLGGAILPFPQSGMSGGRVHLIDSSGVTREFVGKVINSFALGTNTILYTNPTKIDFKDIVGVQGAVSVTLGSNLQTITAPSMAWIGGGLTLFNATSFRLNGVEQSWASSLQSVSFPSLRAIVGSLTMGTGSWAFRNGNTFSFPLLETVGGMTLTNISVVVAFPELKFSTGAISVNNFDGNPVSFPKLQGVGGNLSITNTVCNNLSLSQLKYVSGSITITGNTSLQNLSLDSLIAHGTGHASFANNALNQASVDNILAAFARFDGNNGADTTGFNTGQTLTLTGGTNAAPSAAGVASANIIRARGATVNTN